MAGRPEHGRLRVVGPKRAWMPVVDPDIGLELDDPPGPEARLVIANESRSEQATGGLEGGAGEQRSVDDGSGSGL